MHVCMQQKTQEHYRSQKKHNKKTVCLAISLDEERLQPRIATFLPQNSKSSCLNSTKQSLASWQHLCLTSHVAKCRTKYEDYMFLALDHQKNTILTRYPLVNQAMEPVWNITIFSSR